MIRRRDQKRHRLSPVCCGYRRAPAMASAANNPMASTVKTPDQRRGLQKRPKAVRLPSAAIKSHHSGMDGRVRKSRVPADRASERPRCPTRHGKLSNVQIAGTAPLRKRALTRSHDRRRCISQAISAPATLRLCHSPSVASISATEERRWCQTVAAGLNPIVQPRS